MKLRPATFLVAFSFLASISLGFWQLSRLSEKNALVHQIRSALNEAPAPLPKDFTAKASDVYKKYKLEGKFLLDKNMLLYSSNSSHPERHGYFVMTPFVMESGKVVLINRGWTPQSLRPDFLGSSSTGKSQATHGDNQNQDEEEGRRESDTIEAMVIIPKAPSIFIPKNDIEHNVWVYVDLKAMEDFAKTPIEQGFYMVLIRGKNLPKGLVVKRPEDFIQIRNDHLWYAITWFSLALTVFVIYYFRTQGKSSS